MLHLDERDTERIRVRAYFLSEDSSRASRHDAVKNWTDAELLEQGILLQLLNVYPTLQGIFSARLTPADLSICYVGDLLRATRDAGVEFGLAELDNILSSLVARFGMQPLYEQLDDLFLDSDRILSENRWLKATTEIHALAFLENHRALASLGWPPPTAGTSNTPPFDCRVDHRGTPIPCDIKPASNSGLRLVTDALRPIAQSWATKYGLQNVDIEVRYSGTVAQQNMGPALRNTGVVAQFEQALDQFSSVPQTPLAVNLGGTRFDVTIVAGASVFSSTGTQSPAAVVAALVPTLERHIRQKANAATANGNAPFLLCYVRLPSSGASDIKSRHYFRQWFASASANAPNLGAAASLWLGVLFLDFTTGSPDAIGYFRPSATWLNGATPASLAQATASQFDPI